MAKTTKRPTHATAKFDNNYHYTCAESCGWFAKVDWLAPKSKVTVIIPGDSRAAHSIKP